MHEPHEPSHIAELRDTYRRLQKQIVDARLAITTSQEQLDEIRQRLEKLGYRLEEPEI